MKRQYSEEDVILALKQVANGVSERQASVNTGVPRTTIQSRKYGHTSHQTAAEPLQKLSSVQEKRLTEWILTQESLGLGPTHLQIRQFAERILAIREDSKPLGKRWFQGFLRRNPILRTKKQFRVDTARVNGATTAIIRAWFQKLALPEIRAIKPENRWNMDEAGIMEGQGLNALVVGSTSRRIAQKKQPGSRAWTSFIECISAIGKALDPLVIFKGKSCQQQWFPIELDQYSGWKFTATQNGWTTDATALEWLTKVFIPQTTPQNPQEPRLLIFDGHGSHETTEFMYTCFQHNIYLLFLPPHTSHVLQPLDLSVFSPLKSTYRKELGYLTLLTDSTVTGKRNFLQCYQKARKMALTSHNIKSGWNASGLWPRNASKPLMSRLLLENSNQSLESELADLNKEEGPISSELISSVTWSTPRASKDLRFQSQIATQSKELDLPTR